ncbi:MAG: response regulator [bacterium]
MDPKNNHKQTILCIDDDPSNRMLVRALLQKAGFTVEEAETGMQGIAKAREIIPDLVLMDMNMPDLDGYAATIRIRSLAELDHTKIVALTGNNMQGDRELAIAAGCDGYITKPVNLHTLGDEVDAYLKGQQEKLDYRERATHLATHSRHLVINLESKIQELSKINHELEQRVEQKAAELQETQQQLLQHEKMASIGQLAAGVAHEINNPVGYVSSNLQAMGEYLQDILGILRQYELLESSLEDSLPGLAELRQHKQDIDLEFIEEDLPNLLNESLEGTKRVRQIVQDLKEFSHAGETQWETVSIISGLESTLNIVYHELKYKASIRKDFSPIPPIKCQPAKLNQVFMNLLVNAGHAIEDKGQIIIRVFPVGRHWIKIEIEDDGKGMSPDVQKKLFDPFFTTKPVGEGTGLGLSLSYGIIADHKGTIEVTSEMGKGSCFYISLPVDPENVQPMKNG